MRILELAEIILKTIFIICLTMAFAYFASKGDFIEAGLFLIALTIAIGK